MSTRRKPTEMEAGSACIPFGVYKGQAIEDIAKTDKGLKYLDWLLGQPWVFPDLKECLNVYLTTPHTARAIEVLLEDR